jgi:hypothetical protein
MITKKKLRKVLFFLILLLFTEPLYDDMQMKMIKIF